MTLYTTTADFQAQLRALLGQQPKPLDAAMVARRTIDNMLVELMPDAYVILNAVASAHNITLAELTGRNQAHKFVWPRHHAAWELRRRRPNMPLTKIAAWLNRTDHSTVVNSLKQFGHAVEKGRYAGERALVERAIPC